jgi:hypothetical protein
MDVSDSVRSEKQAPATLQILLRCETDMRRRPGKQSAAGPDRGKFPAIFCAAQKYGSPTG